MTDFSLVNDGVLAIEWLSETDKVENADKTLLNLWNEKFRPKYGKAKIFNKGSLIMASYLFFVYIKESEYSNFDFSKVDYSNFTILTESKPHDTGIKLTNRLRNSISHGRFNVSNDYVIFEDERPDGSDYIKFKINIVEFGEFLSYFLIEVQKQLSL
jgi:hypothetical protein